MNDMLAQPVIIGEGVAPGCQPVLQQSPRFGMRSRPHVTVGLGDERVVRALFLPPLELLGTLRGSACLDAELVAPLVERAAEDAEHGQDAEHRQRKLERQEGHPSHEHADAKNIADDQQQRQEIDEPETLDHARERNRVDRQQHVPLEPKHGDGGGERERRERRKNRRRRGAPVGLREFHSGVNQA